jgi:hypothetical protein
MICSRAHHPCAAAVAFGLGLVVSVGVLLFVLRSSLRREGSIGEVPGITAGEGDRLLEALNSTAAAKQSSVATPLTPGGQAEPKERASVLAEDDHETPASPESHGSARSGQPVAATPLTPDDEVALAAAITLPAPLVGLDVVENEPTVDLGHCGRCPSDVALACPPTDRSSGTMTVVKSRGNASPDAGDPAWADAGHPAWKIEWTAAAAELDRGGRLTIAAVEWQDGRLTLTMKQPVPPGALGLLARCVLLVKVPGATAVQATGGWTGVRLVQPASMRPIAVAMFGAAVEECLPLPSILVDSGLPMADVDIECTMGDKRVFLATTGADEGNDEAVATAELTAVEIGDGAALKWLIEVMSRPAHIRVTPVVRGRRSGQGWRQAIRKWLERGDRGVDSVAEELTKCDRAVQAISVISLAAATGRDGSKIDRFLATELLEQAWMPDAARVAPKESLGIFLGGDPESAATAFGNWYDQCRDIGASLGRREPGAEKAWDEHFRRKLVAWWDWQRPQMENELAALAAGLRSIREQQHVRVERVISIAIGPDGSRYDVPLVQLDEGPDSGNTHPPKVGSVPPSL